MGFIIIGAMQPVIMPRTERVRESRAGLAIELGTEFIIKSGAKLVIEPKIKLIIKPETGSIIELKAKLANIKKLSIFILIYHNY